MMVDDGRVAIYKPLFVRPCLCHCQALWRTPPLPFGRSSASVTASCGGRRTSDDRKRKRSEAALFSYPGKVWTSG